jgi:hypothetical protein
MRKRIIVQRLYDNSRRQLFWRSKEANLEWGGKESTGKQEGERRWLSRERDSLVAAPTQPRRHLTALHTGALLPRPNSLLTSRVGLRKFSYAACVMLYRRNSSRAVMESYRSYDPGVLPRSMAE